MGLRDIHPEQYDHSEDANTTEFEEERLKQMVLAYLANRPDTTKLNAEAREKIPQHWNKSSSNESWKSYFVTLPRGMTSRAAPHWLIQFEDMDGKPFIGIELVSDIVLGVTRSQVMSSPDFDLAPYGAAENGISRRHAMLRPSANKLYLIDLASTNGTRLNGELLQPNLPTSVEDGDLISLGAQSFSISIIATPEDFEAAQYPR